MFRPVAWVIAMKHFLFSLLLLTASLGVMAAAQDSRPPLSKDEVLDLLTSSTPSKVIISTLQQNGIAFQPTPQLLEEFRKAGADKAVLAALREAWHEEIPKPLSDKEIRMMLAEDVSSENIAAAVLERGIDFQATPGYLEALRSEGAKDGLIDTLRAAAPRPFSKDELLQLLATRVDQAWIAPKIQERGIDFDPGKEYLQALQTRGAGAAPGSCSHRQAHEAFCGALPAAPKGVHRSGAREASRSHLRSVGQRRSHIFRPPRHWHYR